MTTPLGGRRNLQDAEGSSRPQQRMRTEAQHGAPSMINNEQPLHDIAEREGRTPEVRHQGNLFNLSEDDTAGTRSGEDTSDGSDPSEDDASDNEGHIAPDQVAEGEGDISMLINAVHANTATNREMLLIQRKQLKMLKALNKETKHVGTVTASRSTGGTKNNELTKEQKKDMLEVAKQLFYVNPYPEAQEVAAALRSRLGADTDVAAVPIAGNHGIYTALINMVKQKLTSTVRFNFSTAIKSAFQQHYSECYKDGKVRQSKAQKFLEENKYRATSNATPYARPNFIKLLNSVYAALVPRNNPTNPKITWLGRGHVAFADIMVWWLLQNNKDIPKACEPGYDDFEARWMETLAATRTMPDSATLKFTN